MGKITFILGGARSGKSDYAAEQARRIGKGAVAYIATGEAKDAEMKRRIALHRKSRPAQWKTYEEPLCVSRLLGRIRGERGVIVLDCLTLLVSNLMLRKVPQEAIEQEMQMIISGFRQKKASAIIVSNEVGLGIVSSNRLARDFRDTAGAVNKLVAKLSDDVIFMISGIPCTIKRAQKTRRTS